MTNAAADENVGVASGRACTGHRTFIPGVGVLKGFALPLLLLVLWYFLSDWGVFPPQIDRVAWIVGYRVGIRTTPDGVA